MHPHNRHWFVSGSYTSIVFKYAVPSKPPTAYSCPFTTANPTYLPNEIDINEMRCHCEQMWAKQRTLMNKCCTQSDCVIATYATSSGCHCNDRTPSVCVWIVSFSGRQFHTIISTTNRINVTWLNERKKIVTTLINTKIDRKKTTYIIDILIWNEIVY